jgi:hypothetical protein
VFTEEKSQISQHHMMGYSIRVFFLNRSICWQRVNMIIFQLNLHVIMFSVRRFCIIGRPNPELTSGAAIIYRSSV